MKEKWIRNTKNTIAGYTFVVVGRYREKLVLFDAKLKVVCLHPLNSFNFGDPHSKVGHESIHGVSLLQHYLQR